MPFLASFVRLTEFDETAERLGKDFSQLICLWNLLQMHLAS